MTRTLLALVCVLLTAGPLAAQTGSSPHDAAIDTVSALTLDPSLREIPPPEPRTRPGAATLLLLGFALLIVMPFLPGLAEIYWPRDRYPLPVDMLYAKDPRYFGTSARSILVRALDVDGVEPGAHEGMMSKPETFVVADAAVVPDQGEHAEILVARGDLRIGAGAACLGEVFARAGVHVGDGARIRALSGETDVRLGDRVVIDRWLDAEGDVTVGEACVMGVSAAAGGAMTLGDGVTFSRLFGAPVATAGFSGDAGSGPRPETPAFADVEEIRTIEDLAEFHKDDVTVAAGEDHLRPMVVRGDLVLKSGAVLANTARVYGDLDMEDGALVHGDLFVEGNVRVGENAAVRGSLFSQGRIVLGRGARVGRPGGLKSLIGKLEVSLGPDVAVHGYILTDGRGRVTCAGSS